MKIFGIVMKIVAALAAIAGIAFVVVKYGDQIVAWFKKTFGDLFYCECECECDCDGECDCCEEAPVEEAAEEVPAEEGEVVAAEADFEG
ncbi:MAG: hypothetical protein E7439_01535 [Ruminococcaceae bacterium]|nr:hypothetical protein [Oscillospiraceae bacterium]